MLASVAALVVALAGLTVAAPAPQGLSTRADAITDTVILQYALTLEHLEDTFYHEALSKFDTKAFKKAGFPSWVRGRFEQIAAHEASHVATLSSALGKDSLPACTYKFPYTDPRSFVALSQAIEGVGTSAYLGAAPLISEKAYLTAAGSILVTEARHDAWVGSAVNKGAAWGLPYETPLGLSGVFSIASQFITACPDGYKFPPVTQYPALTVSKAAPAVGSSIDVKFDNKSNASTLYMAYYSGLSVYYSEIKDGKTTIPAELASSGQVYTAVVTNNTGTPSDSSTLTGLSILSFPFDAWTAQKL